MIRKVRLPRRRTLAAGGSVAAAVFGGGLALDAVGASAQSVSAQTEVSQNWSGYVAQSNGGQNFSSVSGSWVQPAVSSNSTGDGYSAFWVGLGGAGEQSQALEQVGTAAQNVNGQTSYYAWYELVPASQVQLDMAIHPGDHMSAKVSVSGSAVTISLTDQSTGRSVTKQLQMSGPDTSSAEWIAEAPAAELSDGSDQVLPLANFGKMTFTDASATAGGHSGSISDSAWTAAPVDMDNAATGDVFGGGYDPAAVAGAAAEGDAGATPGGLSSGGTAFTVSYSSAVSDPSGTSGADGGLGSAGGGYSYVSPGSGYGDGGYGYGDGGSVYGYGDGGYGDGSYGDGGSVYGSGGSGYGGYGYGDGGSVYGSGGSGYGGYGYGDGGSVYGYGGSVYGYGGSGYGDYGYQGYGY